MKPIKHADSGQFGSGFNIPPAVSVGNTFLLSRNITDFYTRFEGTHQIGVTTKFWTPDIEDTVLRLLYFRKNQQNIDHETIVITSILFLVFFLLVSCSGKQSQNTNSSSSEEARQTRSFKMGIAGFTPRNFPNSTEDDYRDFIKEIPELGEFFGVYAAWDDPFIDNQIELSRQMKGVTPLVIAGFDYAAVNAGYFNIHHDAIIAKLLKIAGEYNLEYLGFGGEVNRLASEKSEAVYKEFIRLYQDVYDTLKDAYPDLKVFTVFQYDYLTGHAHLSGLKLNNQWASLEKFQGRLDLDVFTVYPFLEYLQVSDIPKNYLR